MKKHRRHILGVKRDTALPQYITPPRNPRVSGLTAAKAWGLIASGLIIFWWAAIRLLS